MSIASTFTAITGIVLGKKNPHQGKKVLFHEKALQYGQHGVLLANNKARGFESERIRFVFDGIIEAPSMTPELMEHVWSEAVKQGYEPLSLLAYGSKANPSIAGVSSANKNDRTNTGKRAMPSTPPRQTERREIGHPNGLLSATSQQQQECSAHASSHFDALQQQSGGGAPVPAFLLKKQEGVEGATA